MGEVSGPELAPAGAGASSQATGDLQELQTALGTRSPGRTDGVSLGRFDGPAPAPKKTGIRWGRRLLEPTGAEDLGLVAG